MCGTYGSPSHNDPRIQPTLRSPVNPIRLPSTQYRTQPERINAQRTRRVSPWVGGGPYWNRAMPVGMSHGPGKLFCRESDVSAQSVGSDLYTVNLVRILRSLQYTVRILKSTQFLRTITIDLMTCISTFSRSVASVWTFSGTWGKWTTAGGPHHAFSASEIHDTSATRRRSLLLV